MDLIGHLQGGGSSTGYDWLPLVHHGADGIFAIAGGQKAAPDSVIECPGANEKSRRLSHHRGATVAASPQGSCDTVRFGLRLIIAFTASVDPRKFGNHSKR